MKKTLLVFGLATLGLCTSCKSEKQKSFEAAVKEKVLMHHEDIEYNTAQAYMEYSKARQTMNFCKKNVLNENLKENKDSIWATWCLNKAIEIGYSYPNGFENSWAQGAIEQASTLVANKGFEPFIDENGIQTVKRKNKKLALEN